MFREINEILFVDGYPGYQHLLSFAEGSMGLVCEVKGYLCSMLKVYFKLINFTFFFFY